MLLTDEEKAKFIQYLTTIAESAEGISEQFAKLQLAAPLIAEMQRREKIQSAAARIIIEYLRSGETQTIR